MFGFDPDLTEKKDTQAKEDEDNDLSSFFEGLRSWPLYPSSERSSTSGIPEINQNEELSSSQSSGRSRGISALSNLLKFQVVLDLADGLKGNETDDYFSSIITAADQLFKTYNSKESNNSNVQQDEETINLSGVNTVEQLIEREKWLEKLENIASPFEGTEGENKIARLSITQSAAITNNATTSQQQSLGQAAEAMMKDATSRIEYLVNEASRTTPAIVNDLVFRSTQVFSNNSTTSVEQLTNDIVDVAENIAKTRGLDVQYAADRAREATKGASSMVNVANGLFASGYAYGSRSGVAGSEGSSANADLSTSDSKPLFADFETAQRIEPFQYRAVVSKGAEMGALAGAIYENTLERTHKLGHSVVANGTTSDVAWLITDSIDFMASYRETDDMRERGNVGNDDPMLVRTITLRGFDASDNFVDRERLLNEICKASGASINAETSNILFHSGLLEIAREIYKDTKKYIDWSSPKHRIVFNGHSIGGSLSVLMLLLMTADKGATYVQERVLRVFAHGSPPVATMIDAPTTKQRKRRGSFSSDKTSCQILETFGLKSSMVFGYVQPYDPIVRFLTEYDALYPLVDDLGPDEVTLYATGPPRSLRPITRAMFQSWEGWPQFRENWKGTNQQYRSIGIQHLLLPEPLRYLNDRFISTNIGVPPTEAIVRISSSELLPALNTTFPLDTFQISLLPQAVRSFLHHFYPAYDATIANYASKLERIVEREEP